MMNKLDISVIITTYNNPRGLALVLAGLRRQTTPAREVLVADDGSEEDTRTMIDGLRASFPCPLIHVWQPRKGFRKCVILNQSILRATGNYIVFFDGDCVPTADCLTAHVRAARRNRYVTGGIVRLGSRFSASLTPDAVLSGVLDRFGPWWFDSGGARRLFLSRIPGLRTLLNHNLKRLPGWRGGNASTWADHIRSVGGFDERFTYGYEDADFGHRLEASGVPGHSIRYTAPVLHVDHPRPYLGPDDVAANRKLYDENRALRMTFTPYGLPRVPEAAQPTRV